jgi:hypothetical protein
MIVDITEFIDNGRQRPLVYIPGRELSLSEVRSFIRIVHDVQRLRELIVLVVSSCEYC